MNDNEAIQSSVLDESDASAFIFSSIFARYFLGIVIELLLTCIAAHSNETIADDRVHRGLAQRLATDDAGVHRVGLHLGHDVGGFERLDGLLQTN